YLSSHSSASFLVVSALAVGACALAGEPPDNSAKATTITQTCTRELIAASPFNEYCCQLILLNINDRMNLQLAKLAPRLASLLDKRFLAAFYEHKNDVRPCIDPALLERHARISIRSTLLKKLECLVLVARIET